MIEKEGVLSKEEIITRLGKIKDSDKSSENQKKISFLKELIQDSDYKDLKQDLYKAILPLLTHSVNSKAEYRLTYDSLNEGLEPIYYWVLDFMRDTKPGGIDLDVKKGTELFESSVSSGYFGEMGQRLSLMQQKSMEYMGTINNIIKSMVNLVYDLSEFKIRLESYDKLKSKDDEEKKGAIASLKGIWMDQVDAKKGRGSINLMTQDLTFVTLRDAFFHVNTPKEAKELDLNLRVKNVLMRKLEEYNNWVVYSEKEIRKRYEIERVYLKSQYGTLKLYTNWVKPYLLAAQKLKVTEFKSADIVSTFSNMEMELSLYGKKEIKPGSVHESYSDISLDRKYYSVVEVKMHFRSLPATFAGQGGRHYVHSGRTDIIIRGFVFDDIELEAREKMELYEDLDLIDQYVGQSLTQLQKEIDEFLVDKPKVSEESKPKKKKQVLENPLKGAFAGFGEIIYPIAGIFSTKKNTSYIEQQITSKAADSVKGTAFLIYNVYKKTHGMLNI